MKFKDYLIRIIKKVYVKISNKSFNNSFSSMNRQSANSAIFQLLTSDKPCMISRFGTTELICINNYLCIKSKESFLTKIWNFISDKTHTPWWFEDNFKYLSLWSGVFPPTQKTAEKFSERYLADIPEIDLLGSFQYYEKFMPLRSDVIYFHLETLYPFFVEHPWTLALKDKKVLIVHPFDTTILNQYKKRKQLFLNEDIIPNYHLITYKAVQSVADTKVPFKDWFHALKFMEDDISNIDFDICLLGCGAYGLPLAAHVKRMGKKAVHIGGGLQLLFGIKGNRWDAPNYYKGYNYDVPYKQSYNEMYNESWIKPMPIDTIESAKKVENGSYW